MYYAKIGELKGWLKQRPLISFTLLHALLFLAVFASLDYLTAGHGFERSFAIKMLDSMLPYSDFASEYPPLALFSFLLPAMFSPDFPVYDFLFAVQIYLLNLVILFILAKLSLRFEWRIWNVLGIYTLCLIAMGPIVTGRFDLLPAALVLVALYAFVSGRNKTAWGFLALGASAKLYPLVMAPLFFLYLLRGQQYRRLIQGIAVFIAVIMLLNLPWAIISWDGFGNVNSTQSFLGYHFQRDLHSESSYGLILVVGKLMGLTQFKADLTFGSWNIISPVADAMAGCSFYISIAFLAILYFICIRTLLKKPYRVNIKGILDNDAAQFLLRLSILAVLIMLLTSKVFSPQFMIWLCPLIPLVNARWRYLPLALFLIAAVITQYIYPHNYIAFELFTPHLVVMMVIRNLLLLAMAVIYILPIRSPENGEIEKGIAGKVIPSGIA